MKLTHIRDLVAVAERGSVRAAAKYLGASQPAVSRSIRELEKELGADLFERSALGVVLTPIGETFLQRASVAQSELQRAKDEVQQIKGTSTGTVSIGLSTATLVSLMPKVFPAFRRIFPNVRLSVEEGLFTSLESQLREGHIDFYIGPTTGDRPSGEFHIEKLFDNARVVMGRRGHPLCAAKSLRDLVDARWVATSVTIERGAELNPIFERAGLPKPTVAALAHSGLSVLMLAASSDLLALLPQQYLAFAEQTKFLQRIPVKEHLAAPPIFIVRRARLPLTPIAEHLCDLFRRAVVHGHADIAGLPPDGAGSDTGQNFP